MSTPQISAVRVQTVDNYITAEPSFAAKLGPRETIIVRRDGQQLKFPKEVVEITSKLIEQGLDPVHAGKGAILNAAAQYFCISAGMPKTAPQVATPVAAGTKPVEPAVVVEKTESPEAKWVLSIWSLLLSAYELTTRDKTPGAEARSKRLGELVKEYQSVN